MPGRACVQCLVSVQSATNETHTYPTFGEYLKVMAEIAKKIDLVLQGLQGIISYHVVNYRNYKLSKAVSLLLVFSINRTRSLDKVDLVASSKGLERSTAPVALVCHSSSWTVEHGGKTFWMFRDMRAWVLC